MFLGRCTFEQYHIWPHAYVAQQLTKAKQTLTKKNAKEIENQNRSNEDETVLQNCYFAKVQDD